MSHQKMVSCSCIHAFAFVATLAAGLTFGGPVHATPVTSGLVGWFDAQDIDGDGLTNDNPADAAHVPTWIDKSSAGNDLTSTSGSQPLYKVGTLNGKNIIDFIGGAQFLSASSSTLNMTSATIFAVRDAPFSTALVSIAPGSTIDNEFLIYTKTIYHHSSFNNSESLGHDAVPSGFFVQAAVFGTTPTDLQNFIDGVASTQSSVTTNSPTNYTEQDRRISIGGRNDGNTLFPGDIAEVLIYNRKLSAGELNQVGYYLADKYGIETTYTANVPEPSALWLLAVGAVASVGFLRRKGTR